MVQVSLTMPDGTSAETTIAYLEQISAGAVELQKDYFDEARGNSVISGIIAFTEGESRGKVMVVAFAGTGTGWHCHREGAGKAVAGEGWQSSGC